MKIKEAIKQFESVKFYKNFEEFIEDCGDSRVKDGIKICGNPVNSLLFRGYGICDEDHCPDYKKCVEHGEEHRQLAELLKELKQLKEQEPCEDCVSRQAAIDSLGECPMVWTDSDAEITTERDWKDTVEMLKSLPSVTPQEPILDKIYADIQRLRGCSCSCSDGIIDDIEDILDKYRAESEDEE